MVAAEVPRERAEHGHAAVGAIHVVEKTSHGNVSQPQAGLTWVDLSAQCSTPAFRVR